MPKYCPIHMGQYLEVEVYFPHHTCHKQHVNVGPNPQHKTPMLVDLPAGFLNLNIL